MEIILKEDITGLGEEGDIKIVKDGYARNFLIPKKLAVISSKKNKKEFEARKGEIEARKAQKREEARTLEERLKTIKINITKNAGENGKLFGSVTNTEIAEKLLDMNIDIDRRKIEILKPIKVIGEHSIRIKLHEHVQPEMTVNVIREGEEETTTISEEKLKQMEEEQSEKPEEENHDVDEENTESAHKEEEEE